MSEQRYIINDFSGGTVDTKLLHRVPDRYGDLQHFMHNEGNLRSMEGRKVYNSTQIVSDDTNEGIWGHFRFYKTGHMVNNAVTTKQGWTLAKCGTIIWLDVSTGDTGTFEPLIGACAGIAAAEYIGGRTTATIETFAEFNGRCYIANGVDEQLRWDGFFYSGSATTTTVTCTGGTSVTGNGTAWGTGTTKVQQGDIIFFYDHNAAAWQTGATAQVIKQVQATTLTLFGNGFNTTGKGAGGGNNVNYIIVRVHKMGVTAATTCTAAAPSSGGSLTASSSYIWKWRYKNSVTGYTGTISSASTTRTTDATNKTVVVSGWLSSTRPTDYQINQVEIWRTQANGATYYLATTLSAANDTYLFAADYTDDKADSTLGTTALDSDAAYHTKAGDASLSDFVNYNSRLYARGTGQFAHELHLSSLNSPEYWPTFQFGIDDPTDIDYNLGGYALISSVSDKIKGFVPEGSGQSGDSRFGANLFILTRTGAYRWYGWDWLDFVRVEAFKTSCPAHWSDVSAGGHIFWVSASGPMKLASGTNSPIPLYQLTFPESNTFQDRIEPSTATVDYYLRICGIVWRDWYIWSWTRSGQSGNKFNNRMQAYHIPSDTATSLDAESARNTWGFTRWNGPGDNDQLYYGDNEKGYLWQLFAKTSTRTYWPLNTAPTGTVGVVCTYRTRLLDFGGPHRLKQLSKVILTWQKPANKQTVTWYVFTNGCTATGDATTTTGSFDVETSGTDRYAFSSFAPGSTARLFQLRLDGTFTDTMVLEQIEFVYTDRGDAFGETIG